MPRPELQQSGRPYVRVTLTEAQRRSRLRSLVAGLAASALLLAVLLVAAFAWFDGAARWALLAAALVPLAVCLLALRGAAVLGRAGGPSGGRSSS